MDPTGLTPADWLMRAMEPPLDPREIDIRERFVSEYLIDEDPVRAAQRVGFPGQSAIEYSQKFMAESYVQRRIRDGRYAPPATAAGRKLEEQNDKRIVRAALLREAHYYGEGSSHFARVTAQKALAKMYGMDGRAVGVTDVPGARGGVMVVPPIPSDADGVDAWEAQAKAQQQRLLAHGRT